MIKYWSTLITVSGISPSAKLSSLHGNKRRVKLVRFSKQESVYFFFSVLDAIENKQLISNRDIFYTFRGNGGANLQDDLSERPNPPTQKIPTHNDGCLWNRFFSPPIWTQSRKRLHFLQNPWVLLILFPLFSFRKAFPFVQCQHLPQKSILWDLICVLSCLCLFIFYFFGICLFAPT